MVRRHGIVLVQTTAANNCFYKKFLKEIKKQTPNYEFELGRMVIPTPFPVSHDREKSELNRPVAVVGVDPKTNEVKEKYDTISEARANGYRNVSLVISGKSNRQTCGGLRWFRAEKFKSDTVPAMEPANIGLPVFCKERNQHFLSAMDAERSLRELGFEITGSHISSVINGKRQMAGGLTWSYSPLSRLDIQNQKPGDIIDYIPARNRNSPHPVKLINANDPLTTSHYGSMSEAARSINTSPRNISKALKTGKSIKGFFVEIP